MTQPPTDPDEWIDSPSGQRVIEAAARAYFEWACVAEGEASRWDEPGPHRQFARARAEAILRAALALTSPEGDPELVPFARLERTASELCVTHDIAAPPRKWHMPIFGCDTATLYRLQGEEAL